MNCRICMESVDLNEAIGDICHCKNVYFHESCAIKWYTPRIQGTSVGKATQDKYLWKTIYNATCEVCNSIIDRKIVNMCILSIKKQSFKRFQKQNHVTPINTHPIEVRSPTLHRQHRPSVWLQCICFRQS